MTRIIAKEYTEFLEQLKEHIATSRYKAALAVNSKLILLYHHIGTEILKRQKEHGWGSKVIEQLSRDLRAEFPEMKGFGIANLHNMRRFAELYPNPEFLQQVAGILPWYHHVVLMERVKDHEARLFYIKNASEYGWSRAIMIHQIELGLHKRQGKAVTNFREKLPYPTSDLANQTLKDPYVFDFLSIGKNAHEREIEKGLVAHIEKFLLALGAGFSFVGRQYHLTVRQKDYYLDLLFVGPENLVYEYQEQEKSRFSWRLNSVSLDIGVTVWSTFWRVGNSLKCKHGTEGDNSKLNRRSLQTKLNMVTQETCVRTVVRSEYAKGVDTHKPKWCETKEESEVNRSGLNVLSLRRKAGTYVQRETKSWNGITIIGALSRLSRWPAVCSIMEGLSQKLMSKVMFGIC